MCCCFLLLYGHTHHPYRSLEHPEKPLDRGRNFAVAFSSISSPRYLQTLPPELRSNYYCDSLHLYCLLHLPCCVYHYKSLDQPK
nr:hypothetical protein Iba_chr02bCG18650 [Ipomoea batatas]GMC65002.1 hypothetical protein Iba_chr02dCG10080 [Ipomoea batatas]GMD25743.1 hypothetical protein Iba_chr08cCG13040 [Ipomoea batatas]